LHTTRGWAVIDAVYDWAEKQTDKDGFQNELSNSCTVSLIPNEDESSINIFKISDNNKIEDAISSAIDSMGGGHVNGTDDNKLNSIHIRA
jgi:hypothetical protein